MSQTINLSIICINHTLNANNFAAITRAKSMHHTRQCHTPIEIVIRDLNGYHAVMLQANIFGSEIINAALDFIPTMMYRRRHNNRG
ncbi:MAG: hypothetical protein IJ268_03935, partial [Proteobacteria bacterium]|nr:hypothetical protein [Pseudomonadota bacterium]